MFIFEISIGAIVPQAYSIACGFDMCTEFKLEITCDLTWCAKYVGTGSLTSISGSIIKIQVDRWRSDTWWGSSSRLED